MSEWNQTKNRTVCRGSLLTFDLDALHPTRGLTSTDNASDSQLAAGLLSVRLSGTDDEQKPTEVYARGDDIVATYPQTPQLEVQRQVYWRNSAPVANGQGIELILSIQTSSLDSRPSVDVTSTVPMDECWRWSTDASKPERLSPDGWETTGEHALLLFRNKNWSFSYAEMVFPSDLARVRTARCSENPDHVLVTHSLRIERLEKGVIRRARMLGIFVSRDTDVELVRETRRIFTAEVPPLTT